MKYLFVGGHNNGKRIELPDNPPPRIVMPVYPSEPSKYDAPAEYFEAIPFEAEGGRFIVYAIYGMSPLQVLEAMIDRYPEIKSSPARSEGMTLKYQNELDAINRRRP